MEHEHLMLVNLIASQMHGFILILVILFLYSRELQSVAGIEWYGKIFEKNESYFLCITLCLKLFKHVIYDFHTHTEVLFG